MNELKSNDCDDSRLGHVCRLVLVAFFAVCLTGEVMAQSQQEGDNAATGLTPDQAFSGIQRTGAVGQNTATAVGANATSAAAAGQGAGGATGRAGGGFGGGGLGAAFGNLLNNNASQGTSSSPPIRTRLRSAVTLSPGMVPSTQGRQYAAQSRFQAAPSLQRSTMYSGPVNPYRDVDVQIRERTAILQGRVANEGDRRMSELLMRLEPGVNRVQNQISVAP